MRITRLRGAGQMKKALETGKDKFKTKLGILPITVIALAFSLLLLQVGSVSSALQHAGAVSNDKSVWWEVDGVGLLNVTPEVAKVGETVLYEYANYTAFNDGLNITLRFRNDEGYVDVVEVLRDVQKPSITYNISVEELYNPENSSYYNQTTVNTSITAITVREWVNIPVAKQVTGNDYYYTAKFFIGEQVRFKPKAKTYGGLIKYDTILHPSTLSPTQQIRVEIDPILNATAFNVTSNSDLNLTGCQPDCAKFVSGHLLLAAGNRTNITIHETINGNFQELMTRWTPYNNSGNIGGFLPSGYSLQIIEGVLNMTVSDGPNEAETNLKIVGADNLSVPETSGMVLSGYMRFARTDGEGGYGWGLFCFVNDWDAIINMTSAATSTRCGKSQGAGFDIGAGSLADGGGAKAFGYQSAGTRTNFGVGKRCQDCFNHFLWWFNWTHQRVFINQSEGSGVDSGLVAIPSANAKMSSGGKLVLAIGSSSDTTPNSISFENVTLANASQFGQPLNFTAARLKTNVMNSTVTTTSVKVSNQTFNYSDTAASWYVFDASLANLQNLTEGSFNTITSITGLGVNATVSPTHLDSATEFTSILVEWQKGNGSANPTEQQGDDAISAAIQSSVPNTRKYPNQRAYVVNASNAQWQGTVDYLVIQDNPPKRWLLNYITTGESYLNARNLSNVVYVLELANKSSLQIEQEMSALMDATKN